MSQRTSTVVSQWCHSGDAVVTPEASEHTFGTTYYRRGVAS